MDSLLWLPVALVAYAMFAVTNIFDRIIVHNQKTSPALFSFWVAVFSTFTVGIALVGYIPLSFLESLRFVTPPSLLVAAYAIAAGYINQGSLYMVYRALEKGEVSRVTSTVGAVTPVATVIVSYMFLNERLNAIAYAAILLLIAGAFVLTRNFGSRKARSSAAWLPFAIAASVMLALQSVLIKLAFEDYHFISAYALTGLGALAYVGTLAAFSKTVRSSLMAKKPKQKTKQKKGNSHVALIMFNSALGSIAAVLINLAVDLGSPTSVNALRGVQYALVFVAALALASRFPRLLDEELNRRVILLKLSGIVLVANGVVLLAIA